METPPELLTPGEQNRNIQIASNSLGNSAMSETSPLSDARHYEQACDQAIAMCDGNLRSTIKALIMANEYLEAELSELQAAVELGCSRAGLPETKTDAA
jgi:hypothetical protein